MDKILKFVFEFVKLVGKHASVSLDVTEDGKLKICILFDMEQVVK